LSFEEQAELAALVAASQVSNKARSDPGTLHVGKHKGCQQGLLVVNSAKIVV